MKKKIWIINHYATPPSYGGLNRHYYLSQKLADKYNIKIIASSALHNSEINMIKNNEKYINKKIENVNYIYIRTRNYKNKIQRVINMLQFYLNGKRVLKKLDKPDIIYTSMPHLLASLLAVHISKKYKIPLIVETRDLWPESIISFGMIKRNGIIAKILYMIEKYIYLHADKLIFTMEGGIDYLKERKYADKINFRHVYNLNNGADLEKVLADKKKHHLKDNDLDNKDTFKVIYTGSIRFAYKVDILVELAKKIQNANYDNICFLIYGDGPYKDELIEKCKKEKIKNIKFKGFIDSKYIPYIMTKCNLALLHGENFDVFRYGTSQNKLFTYLAAGIPIISTFPNKYDLVSRYNCGKAINADDIDEYFKAIIDIYNLDDNKYKLYCKNSINLSKKYDYSILSKKLEKIIEEE